MRRRDLGTGGKAQYEVVVLRLLDLAFVAQYSRIRYF